MSTFRTRFVRPLQVAAAVMVLALPGVSAAQQPGWYYGLGGYYTALRDSDGETFTPGTPGSPGSAASPCALPDLLGLGTLVDQLGLTDDEGCLLGLLGPGLPGSEPIDPTQAQTLRTLVTFKDGWAAELSLGYLYGNGWRPELSFAYARNDWDAITLTASNGGSVTSASSNRLDALRLMGNLWYELALDRWRPYLGAGIGLQRSEISGDTEADDSGFAYQLGAGLGVALSGQLRLSLDYRYAVADDPEYETANGGTLATEYEAHNVGLSLRYTFAPAQSAAPAPEPARIVEPVQTPEPIIRCPDTPAGIPVGPDNCPLDSDGDGIPDHLDECPRSPPGAKVLPNGCALEGDCRKPRPGEEVDENGCALERSFILRGVNFEFDSDRLTPEARSILNDVAETLQAYPDINVDVEGHTDWIGTEAYNLGLSERRANAVKRYLADRGVTAGRMNPVGYGESRPIASNETEAGRELNRRVELKVLD